MILQGVFKMFFLKAVLVVLSLIVLYVVLNDVSNFEERSVTTHAVHSNR
jgi:hypothetical protein